MTWLLAIPQQISKPRKAPLVVTDLQEFPQVSEAAAQAKQVSSSKLFRSQGNQLV